MTVTPTQHHVPTTSWTGLRGRIGSWAMSSWPRRVFETFVAGDISGTMVRILALSGHETVVDLGCGPGFYTLNLTGQLPRGRVIAVDLSEEMLSGLRRAAARRKVAERVEIRPGNATALPLSDGEADAVVSVAMIHEVPQPAAVLAEMTRAVKPGGRVLVADFNADRPMGERVRRGHRGEDVHGPFAPGDLTRFLKQAGLVNVEEIPLKDSLVASGTKPA